MRNPSPRDYEDRSDYEDAVHRYEAWSDSEREFRRDAEAEAEMVAAKNERREEMTAKYAVEIAEEKFERAWENWCAENWRA